MRAWSARLNAYDNAGVARLFSRPATFVQGGTSLRLETSADIALWHSLLPCAGRIVSIAVEGERAIAVFVLANGRNRRCDAPGAKAAAVFRIRGGKIRALDADPGPEAEGADGLSRVQRSDRAVAAGGRLRRAGGQDSSAVPVPGEGAGRGNVVSPAM